MFGEALLESAPALRRRRHWPMATAFTLQLAVAAVLVVLPLLSTGIIPLKATVIVPTPPKYTPLENHQPTPASGGHTGPSVPTTHVVPVNVSHFTYIDPLPPDRQQDSPDGPPDLTRIGGGGPKGLSDIVRGQPVVVPPPVRPVIISHTTEAMLLNKVVPEYPLIAKISGIQGDVQLHAFVSRDGTIRSLTVIGNPPPVLLQAAMKAVQQWKYRPYYLNGAPVEIETFITVTFKKSN